MLAQDKGKLKAAPNAVSAIDSFIASLSIFTLKKNKKKLSKYYYIYTRTHRIDGGVYRDL